jgi:hypothetical protein
MHYLTTEPSNHANVYRFGAIELLNGNILVLGGKQEGTRTNTCLEYSIKEKACIESTIKLTT